MKTTQYTIEEIVDGTAPPRPLSRCKRFKLWRERSPYALFLTIPLEIIRVVLTSPLWLPYQFAYEFKERRAMMKHYTRR